MSTWFGCQRCHGLYPTVDRAFHHLRADPVHTNDISFFSDKYPENYRLAAIRSLIVSFTVNSPADHDAAISEGDTEAAENYREDGGPIPKRARLDHVYIDNSNRSQNVYMAPITVRVIVCPRPAHEQDVFQFKFAREEHTTIEKLLSGVLAAYRLHSDQGVDLMALGAERLMMTLNKKGGRVVGGLVQGEEDVSDLSGVLGDGWFGLMEIG